jgi:uncharacterized membrane protein YbaN (DUF454 family)
MDIKYPGEGAISMKTHSIGRRVAKGALVVAGTLSLCLGILGIFLPLLPTTPFLLLAVACYARSSQRLHDCLLSNRWLGKHVRNYLEKRGATPRVKVSIVLLLWIAIGYSTIAVVDGLLLRIILIVIAVAVTAHICFIRTLRQ